MRREEIARIKAEHAAHPVVCFRQGLAIWESVAGGLLCHVTFEMLRPRKRRE